jgi:ABC-type Na+ efflux pump permease subunit
VNGVWTIVVYGLREALRRKVFAVVLLLTAGFLFLYWLANHYAFRDVENIQPPAGIDPRPFAGAFIFGLAMFATLFLGVVLAVFLTLGAVRGDAERGLLQPLLVRPVSRPALLLARWLGAVGVCTPYVVGVYAAGLVAGLLGTIGHALNSHTLEHAAKVAAWVVPFEALYQDALREITANTTGLTGFLLQLGPFGGANTGGPGVRLWACAYLVVVGLVAAAAFSRRDL